MDLPAIFFEVHSDLPREGPGDSQSTAKAFHMLKGLPPKPRILDVGCGPGMQTIELAKLSGVQIEAVDFHQPFLDELEAAAQKAGVSSRIHAVRGDMFNLQYPKESFDLVWCEGAIFVIGFGRGLREWQPLLRRGGYLVASELSWFNRDAAPLEVKAFLAEMYAGMENSSANTVEENLETARKLGYGVVGSFKLPDSGWWDNYYTPIEAKLPGLRAKHHGDADAMAYLDSEEKEISMFRHYSSYYGYAFYVLQKI
ncbi:MAG: class I SAM-dependent methyltransferase [Candidatus Bathyarchaeota archaeon]|nr:class I SAM-dependent methyltransferase [Candidatus Bathyarchaeota archaeon]